MMLTWVTIATSHSSFRGRELCTLTSSLWRLGGCVLGDMKQQRKESASEPVQTSPFPRQNPHDEFGRKRTSREASRQA